MPTPTGLVITELPSGVSPASNGDIAVLVQNGNTVQVPVSAIRPLSTTDLAEGSNLYFTVNRARNAISANNGISYDAVGGVVSLEIATKNKINNAYDASITGVQILEEGNKKTIYLKTNNNIIISGQWIDRGQDIQIDATQGVGSYYNQGNQLTLTNTDRGSSQYIFKSIGVSGQNPIVASSNNDSITFIAGTNIDLVADTGNNRITISATGAANPITGIVAVSGVTASTTTGLTTIYNSDKGSDQNIFKTIAVSGLTSVTATGNNSTLTLVAGSNINFSTDPANGKITINAVSGAGLNGNVTSVNGQSGTVVLTTDNIQEGTSLYFTTLRARNSFTAGPGISINPINGQISNIDGFANNAYFGSFRVSGQTYIYPDTQGDAFYFKAGSGIQLTANNTTNTLTIAATGAAIGIGGDQYSLLHNVNGFASGVVGLYYDKDVPAVVSKDVRFIVGTGSSINKPKLRLMGATGQTEAIQTWENISGNVMSYITNSGCFNGAVTPDIIGVDINTRLDNSHNGKVIETYRNTSTGSIYLYLSSGITIPNWNVKIMQGGDSTAIVSSESTAPLLFPNDRYPRTRKKYSVIEIYKNTLGYVLYGDLDQAPLAITGVMTGTGGTNGTGVIITQTGVSNPPVGPTGIGPTGATPPLTVCPTGCASMPIVKFGAAMYGTKPKDSQIFVYRDQWVSTGNIYRSCALSGQDFIFSGINSYVLNSQYGYGIPYGPLFNCTDSTAVYIQGGSCTINIALPSGATSGCYTNLYVSGPFANTELRGNGPWAITSGAELFGNIFGSPNINGALVDLFLEYPAGFSVYGETYITLNWSFGIPGDYREYQRTYVIPSYMTYTSDAPIGTDPGGPIGGITKPSIGT